MSAENGDRVLPEEVPDGRIVEITMGEDNRRLASVFDPDGVIVHVPESRARVIAGIFDFAIWSNDPQEPIRLSALSQTLTDKNGKPMTVERLRAVTDQVISRGDLDGSTWVLTKGKAREDGKGPSKNYVRLLKKGEQDGDEQDDRRIELDNNELVAMTPESLAWIINGLKELIGDPVSGFTEPLQSVSTQRIKDVPKLSKMTPSVLAAIDDYARLDDARRRKKQPQDRIKRLSDGMTYRELIKYLELIMEELDLLYSSRIRNLHDLLGSMKASINN